MGRLMAIDYGKKRTGIAVTDILKIVPGGLATVETKNLLKFISGYCQKEKVDEIIVGLPKQMNNTDSETKKYIDIFVKKLKEILPDIPVVFYDERFTSVIAHKTMLDGGLKKKKRQNKELVDEISAVIILQSYMDSFQYKN